jgi:hypothetical protein
MELGHERGRELNKRNKEEGKKKKKKKKKKKGRCSTLVMRG